MPKPALLLIAAAMAAPTIAQPTITVACPHDRYPSLQVRTAALDLASADGRRRLDDRLWRAAREV